MSKNKPQIPNYDKLFILSENSNYKSADVLFDFFLKVEVKNLYLICKTMALNKQNLLKNILVIGSQSLDSKERKIFHNVKIRKFEKISYIDFFIFIDDLMEND